MSANVIAILYLTASVLFILSLRGLSHPLTARRGNVFGIVGMSIAVAATLAITRRIDIPLAMLAAGGVVGVIIARRVQMTQMPELVAAMHSLVGLAVGLIASAILKTSRRHSALPSRYQSAPGWSCSSEHSWAPSRFPDR